MPTYQYKVIPAPKKGERAKGVKGTEARFANALEVLMNTYGADGWEYLRTDTLPSEERSGIRGKSTVYQNVLVFRRQTGDGVSRLQPEVMAKPTPVVVRAKTTVQDDTQSNTSVAAE
ncbi:DUF4177 domain-containing protein [Parasulfitobacter algicola]|uniref:DUF4177 domain-containing protein n=1 Tax=Parasulfitobacter algicola TaxID=2614809 RepID=A0ABX2IQH6_9RHOB|nr:DUF4177 domain-containing protein [Sulfitobacter algicola]NSX55141.1 DUF4177 domain-containing protein [Sulfitobacter algicola]